MCIGRIREILILSDNNETVEHVALQHFAFMETLHPSLYLPCLDLTDNEVVLSAAVSCHCLPQVGFTSYERHLAGYRVFRQYPA
jgi:hypothetical protein